MIVSRSAVPRAAAGSRGARHGAPLPPATTSASVRRRSSSSSKGGARLSLRCAATVSDSNVPEGHKGLHSSLYGDGSTAAEDAHAAESAYAPVAGEDDGAALVPVDAYLAAREGRKPAGVFAVHDASRAPQYVGFSRNLVLSLRSLRARLGPSRVAFVRALVVTGQEMLTRAALARRAQEWIDAAPGGVPPGNGAEAELWGGGGGGGGAGSVEASVDTSAMSPAELAAHEERRLKLRRAMGEAAPLPAAQTDADADAEERRQRMIAAMERDDWSAVVGEQTAATVPAGARLAVVAAGAVDEPGAGDAGARASPTSSPFAQATVHRRIGEGGSGGGDGPAAAMTREAVLAALEEVRPLLQADGGDIDLVGIDDGVVSVRLEGACSTCAASSATMKMGVERALRAAFGGALRGVVQVGGADAAAGATVAAVDAHLNLVRPAIVAMGGAVEVASLEGGVCTLRYRGPPPLAKGLVAAVRDQFPDVTGVEVVGF